MKILTPSHFGDYELLDSGNGCRLERFANYTVSRPDPQIIWQPRLSSQSWDRADAVFEKTHTDKGRWHCSPEMEKGWNMSFENLKFHIRLSPFKHTGVFPEQAVHWEWMTGLIKKAKRPPQVLNLFAYTGVATVVAAAAGAKVTHVDASFPTIGWAKENHHLNRLPSDSVRWILDDVLKFVRREVRRGAQYDGIIMDPPAYGRGPKGEAWIFNHSFPQLMELCRDILSPQPLFFIVNAYAISSSALMLHNVLSDFLGDLNGQIECGELALKEKSAGRLLSTGIFARWSQG